jgi:hypothetical protein
MGFLDSLLQWLRSFFSGSSQPVQAATESAIPFESVPHWLEEKTGSVFKELKENALNRFSEIRFLLKEIRTQLTELEKKKGFSEEQKVDERLQRVVLSSQQTMVQRMRILLDKLEPPKAPEWNEIHSYAVSSFGFLQKETELFGKNIAYTSLLHKEEIKGIGTHLSELEQILKSLSASFSRNPLSEQVARAKQLHAELSRLKTEQQQLEQQSYQLEKERKQLEKRLAEQQESIAEKESSSEAKEWKAIQEENVSLKKQREELQKQWSEQLGEIDKPLKRFSQLVSSNQWKLEPEQLQFLSVLSENPFKALEKDPKGQTLKEILEEILAAIDQQRISFKDEKEEAKKRAAILRLQEFDFFSNYFWKQNELEKKRQALEKRLQSSSWNRVLENNQKQLQSVLSEKNENEKESVHSTETLKKNRLLFQEKKETLQKQLSGIASTNVTVSFPEKTTE